MICLPTSGTAAHNARGLSTDDLIPQKAL
jgi:hypothetical protein